MNDPAVAFDNETGRFSFSTDAVELVGLTPDGQWVLILGTGGTLRPSLVSWPGYAAALIARGWGDALANLYAAWEAGEANGDNRRRANRIRSQWALPLGEGASLVDELQAQAGIVADRLVERSGEVMESLKLPDLSGVSTGLGLGAAGAAAALVGLYVLVKR